MDIRTSFVKMVQAHHDGWDGMARDLGMRSPMALENRMYARKGQGLLVSDAMQMQVITGTTFFAEAVAARSGGAFVKLPSPDAVDNESLFSMFNHLYSHMGLLAAKFEEYTSDHEIDKREKADLDSLGDDIHKDISELLTMIHKVYCRDGVA